MPLQCLWRDSVTLISTLLLTDLLALPIAGDSWVASARVSIATQLNSTELNSTWSLVELSCVATNGPLVTYGLPINTNCYSAHVYIDVRSTGVLLIEPVVLERSSLAASWPAISINIFRQSLETHLYNNNIPIDCVSFYTDMYSAFLGFVTERAVVTVSV